MACHLATLGAHVVLAARGTNAIEHIAGEIQKANGRAMAVPTDMTDPSTMAPLIDAATAATGRLDLLVNNAGLIDPIARIADSDPAAWRKVIDVNVKRVYHGLRSAHPVMQAQDSGTIVNISSGAANSALEGWSHYCVSKAAALRLTGVAHKESAGDGVRILGLSPVTVATAMQEEIPACAINPAWVARTVAFLTTTAADPRLGMDFSLKAEEGRKAVRMAQNTAQGSFERAPMKHSAALQPDFIVKRVVVQSRWNGPRRLIAIPNRSKKDTTRSRDLKEQPNRHQIERTSKHDEEPVTGQHAERQQGNGTADERR